MEKFDVAKLKKEIKDQVKSEMEKKNNTAVKIFAAIGIIAVIVLVIYGLIRFFRPDEYEDYDDDVYDDDYDDEDDEEEPEEETAGEEKSEE